MGNGLLAMGNGQWVIGDGVIKEDLLPIASRPLPLAYVFILLALINAPNILPSFSASLNSSSA